MDTMRNILDQEHNEERFNRKHIDTKIRAAIESSPELMVKLNDGVVLVEQYIAQTYYKSKNARLAQITQIDIPELVMDMFVGISYSQRPELFTSVTAQMASRLKFSDKAEAITTVAELIAVICETDAFDIFKAGAADSLVIQSRITLPAEILTFIEESQYLPPMVCEPLELTHNFSSGYLTHNDSLILGSGNHHDGDICLDALNVMNTVALKINLGFVSKFEEVPSEPINVANITAAAAEKGRYLSQSEALIETAKALESWPRFKSQSYMFYELLAKQGNRLFFNHKVDKRGRAYCSGYHLSTQGSPFKKASLEFFNEELISGVPAQQP